MFKKVCWLSVILLFLAALSATAAWANLVALSYTDTNNQQVTAPATQQYINPTTPVILYLSGGLENKVGYTLLDSSGSTVAQGVSDNFITTSDQFTVLGQSYYGKVLTLPAALSDGGYTLTAQIMDSQGNVLASQNASLTVATTPPAVGGIWWAGGYYNAYITGNELVGPETATNIFLKNVSDSIAIDHVQFQSFDPSSGSIYNSVPAWYSASSNTAGIGNGQEASIMNDFPKLSGYVGVRFIVYDKAGNETVQQVTVKYNGNPDNPAPQLVAIYNPNVTDDSHFIPGSGLVGFVPYTPGMTTYANPMQLLYRVPLSEWIDHNPDYGLSALRGTKVYADASYVYVNFTAPYSAGGYLDSNYWRFTSPQWWCAYSLTYNLVLAPDAPLSPVFSSWNFQMSNPIGWNNNLNSGYAHYFNTPSSLIQVQVTAQPRPYTQYVQDWSNPNNYCTIAPGNMQCDLPINFTPTPNAISTKEVCVYLRNQDGSLRNQLACTQAFYDLVPPSITSYSLDQQAKSITFQADEPGALVYHNNLFATLTSGWLTAQQTVQSGAEPAPIKVNGTVTSLGGDNFQGVVNYASLPQGNYSLTLNVQDNSGNTASLSAGQLVIDSTPPQIIVSNNGQPLAADGAVASLGQVAITLTDNVDPNPTLTSVQLKGGLQGINATLGTENNKGTYTLTYPPMFPSNGQEYSLVVTARDASGNVGTLTLPFNYDPSQNNVASTGFTTLNLPLIPAYVVHPDGSNALSTVPLIINGKPLSGIYDLTLMSGTDSTTTIVVQGITLAPGDQKTLPAYDFAATGGKLNLAVRAAGSSDVGSNPPLTGPGQVNLMVTSYAPNFPVITATVNFWQPNIRMSANPGWSVEPIIQQQTLNLVKDAGTPCQLTTDPASAQQADPVNSPVCLVEWADLPTNYQTTGSSATGVLPPSASYTPGYKIYLYNNGQQYQIGSGTGNSLTAAPITDLAFSASTTPSGSLYRKVQTVSVALQSSGSYKCPEVTADATQAQKDAANKVVCLVHWTTVPDGLAPSSTTNTSVSGAQLTGAFNQDGDQTVAWAVDLYSPVGEMANAVTENTTLTVVDPPLPDLSFAADLYGQKINDNLYVTTNLQGGEIGIVKFGTKLPNTNVTLELDGTVDGHVSRQYVSGNNISFGFPIKMGQMALWQNQPVSMKLYYTDLPDLTAEKDISVVGVPSTRIRAVLTAQNQSLDTKGVPLTVQVGIPGIKQLNYDDSTMGDWQAQLGYLDQKNQFQPLTDYQPLTNGVLQTTLTGFQVGFQKIEAQVRLMAPSINIPSGAGSSQSDPNVPIPPAQLGPPLQAPFHYSRVLLSNPAYSVVLKGTAPEGTIYSNTLTGPAPLSSVLALRVDSDTLRIMGQVDWQLSSDNGASWQKISTKTPYQAAVTVNSGQYLARAQMTNQYSGAVGYSPTVQIIAYKVPKLQLTGPRAVIVGTPVDLKAQVTVDGQPAADGDVVIQWYDRSGKNQANTGPDLQITPTDYSSLIYNVRAKMATAPDTDSSAWVRQTIYVRVVPPNPPSGLLAMPGYMEYNTVTAQTYQAAAKMNLPAGLDPAMYPLKGEWHLPDGSVVEGPNLTYSPTAADAAKHQASFEYVTWINGFKDKTTATLRRSVYVGTYSWPDFKINVTASPNVAPALVTLTATPETGSSSDLQKPEYTWQLPASAALVQKQDNGRVMQVSFPQSGSYQVGVTVTDARGSTAQATGTVVLADPPPFQVTFTPYFSNNLHRELLNVTLACHVTGGHPQDHLTTYDFSINSPDATVKSFAGSGVIQGLKAGDYQAHLHATSAMGKTVEVDYPIHVIADQPPVCKITTWDFSGYRWWQASCTDPDGMMAGYRWYKNDQLICSGSAIRVKISDLPGSTIRFHAFDDSVGVYDETVYSGG